MNKRQYIILSIVWFTAIILLSVAFWTAATKLTLDFFTQSVQPSVTVTRSPLAVYFRFPNNTATPQYGTVSSNNRHITFHIPVNSHIEFNYYILSMGKDPLKYVYLYFDYVSEEIGFMDLANQSYPLPFEIEVGTMEINSGKDYGAIIETPAENGICEMQWHVTSNQISYSFRIIIIVGD